MNEKEIVLSIIVPVYNVNDYLEKCVMSILDAKRSDIEVILVDDKSTDGSAQKCDLLASNFNNCFSYHNLCNRGLGATRNYGVRKAKGEYVAFVDSDDYINTEQLVNIIDTLQKNKTIDLFFLNAFKIYSNGTNEPLEETYDERRLNSKTKEEVFRYLASRKKFPASACTKIIRRSILNENNLFFEEGVLSEDLEWVVKALLLSDNFGCIDGEYYYYRQQRKGSITSIASEKRLDGIINAIEKSMDDVRDESEMVKSTISGFMAYEYLIALWMYDQVKKNLTCEKVILYKNFFIKNKKLLTSKKEWKYRIVKVCIEIFGIDFLAGVLTKVKGKI